MNQCEVLTLPIELERNRPQLTPEVRAEIDRVRREYPDEHICAVIFDRTSGSLIDIAFDWHTAQNHAGEYVILAIDHDGTFMPREKIQALCDYEVDIFDDCFGTSFHYN